MMKVNIYNLYTDVSTRLPYLECVHETSLDDAASFRNPQSIADAVRTAFQVDRLAEEVVWLLCADTKMHFIAVFEVSHGSVSQSIVSPSAIMQRVMLSGASQFVLVHNHPSGDPEPSKEDLKVTRRVFKAGVICGAALTDHIIIGARTGKYWSMVESGAFEEAVGDC